MIDFPHPAPALANPPQSGSTAPKVSPPDPIRKLMTRELLAMFSFMHGA